MFPSNPRNYPEVDVPGQAPCIESNVPVFLSPWSLASSSLWPMLGPPTYTYTYHFRPSEIAVPQCSSEPKIPELPKWNGRKVFSTISLWTHLSEDQKKALGYNPKIVQSEMVDKLLPFHLQWEYFYHGCSTQLSCCIERRLSSKDLVVKGWCYQHSNA